MDKSYSRFLTLSGRSVVPVWLKQGRGPAFRPIQITGLQADGAVEPGAHNAVAVVPPAGKTIASTKWSKVGYGNDDLGTGAAPTDFGTTGTLYVVVTDTDGNSYRSARPIRYPGALLIGSLPDVVGYVGGAAISGDASPIFDDDNGNLILTFSLTDGSPDWVTIDPATGVYGGVPAADGTQQVVIVARDQYGRETTGSFVAVVDPRPVPVPSVSIAYIGTPISFSAPYGVITDQRWFDRDGNSYGTGPVPDDFSDLDGDALGWSGTVAGQEYVVYTPVRYAKPQLTNLPALELLSGDDPVTIDLAQYINVPGDPNLDSVTAALSPPRAGVSVNDLILTIAPGATGVLDRFVIYVEVANSGGAPTLSLRLTVTGQPLATNTTPPVIEASALTAGGTISVATPGVYSAGGGTYSYVVLRASNPVPGASLPYVIDAEEDSGSAIEVDETYTVNGGSVVTRSNAIEIGVLLVPQLTTDAEVRVGEDGEVAPIAGTTATATPATYEDAVSITYQWQSSADGETWEDDGGGDIDNGPVYQSGRVYRVQYFATNANGQSDVSVSAPTPPAVAPQVGAALTYLELLQQSAQTGDIVMRFEISAQAQVYFAVTDSEAPPDALDLQAGTVAGAEQVFNASLEPGGTYSPIPLVGDYDATRWLHAVVDGGGDGDVVSASFDADLKLPTGVLTAVGNGTDEISWSMTPDENADVYVALRLAGTAKLSRTLILNGGTGVVARATAADTPTNTAASGVFAGLAPGSYVVDAYLVDDVSLESAAVYSTGTVVLEAPPSAGARIYSFPTRIENEDSASGGGGDVSAYMAWLEGEVEIQQDDVVFAVLGFNAGQAAGIQNTPLGGQSFFIRENGAGNTALVSGWADNRRAYQTPGGVSRGIGILSYRVPAGKLPWDIKTFFNSISNLSATVLGLLLRGTTGAVTHASSGNLTSSDTAQAVLPAGQRHLLAVAFRADGTTLAVPDGWTLRTERTFTEEAGYVATYERIVTSDGSAPTVVTIPGATLVLMASTAVA